MNGPIFSLLINHVHESRITVTTIEDPQTTSNNNITQPIKDTFNNEYHSNGPQLRDHFILKAELDTLNKIYML